jgi:hypothetical protein
MEGSCRQAGETQQAGPGGLGAVPGCCRGLPRQSAELLEGAVQLQAVVVCQTIPRQPHALCSWLLAIWWTSTPDQTILAGDGPRSCLEEAEIAHRGKGPAAKHAQPGLPPTRSFSCTTRGAAMVAAFAPVLLYCSAGSVHRMGEGREFFCLLVRERVFSCCWLVPPCPHKTPCVLRGIQQSPRWFACQGRCEERWLGCVYMGQLRRLARGLIKSFLCIQTHSGRLVPVLAGLVDC